MHLVWQQGWRLASFFALGLPIMLAVASASAGEMYRFAIDRDGLTGTPVCRLNSPIGPGDRIHVADDHFYSVGKDGVPNTHDDQRVRLWGINLSAPLTFPRTMVEAERLAARLERLGFNAVRLHSFYGSKDSPDYMTVIDTAKHYPILNETNMRGVDRLLKSLGDHGIYAHFALHVSYTFGTRDAYLKREISLDGVRIIGTGAGDQFGIVSIVSLDGNPVSASSERFITCLGGKGKSRNLDVAEVDPGRKRYRLMGPRGLPFYHEKAGAFEIETNPVMIRLSSTLSSLSVERLRASGTTRSQKAVASSGGRFTFTVGRVEDETPWYRVTGRQDK